MKKNRNRKEKSKHINLMLFILLCCIGTVTILNSINGNMIIDRLEKNIANAQLESLTESSNIVDLKVSEQNNNFVWTSANGQVNPEIDLKLDTHYTIQIESMDNNIHHQLIIQDETGKQLAK